MRGRLRIAYSCGAFLLMLASPLIGAGRVEWWNPAWKCRQYVQVSTPDPSNRINTALAAIDTLGKCSQKGVDIRVVDETGQLRPHQVVSEEGGFVRVQFSVADGAVRKYWIYYGNPSAGPAEGSWTRNIGQLTLTTWRYPSRYTPGDWEQMQKICEKIKDMERQGSGAREWINERENPFGENDYYLAEYNGEIFCPETGEYGFATNSDDSSFLLIDGVLVASWPWGHEESKRWDHNGAIRLDRGIHRIKYYLIEVEGGQLARAGWKLPSDKYYSTIPKDAYVQELRTEVLSLEEQGKHLSAYFTTHRVQSLRFNTEDRDFVTMKFADCSASAMGTCKYWEWDFGDGEKSLDQNPRHEYVRAGKYTVALKVKDDLGFEDSLSRVVEIAGQDPERISVRFDIEKNRNIVRASEPLVLNLRFRSSSAEPLPLALDTRVENKEGELLAAASDTMQLLENQWCPLRRSYSPRFDRHAIRFSLKYHGVPIAGQTIYVIPDSEVPTDLRIYQNNLVDQDGNLVILRTVESVAKGARDRLRAKVLGSDPIKIVIFDDSLGPMSPGKNAYHDWLKDMVSRGGKRPVEIKKAGQTQGASEFPLYVRLCDFPVDVLEENPDVIIIVCSITDVLNYVPIEMYQRYLSVLIDEALTRPKAALLLVCPPPLVMKPDLSRDYAYATLQMGQLKKVPVVDLFSAFSNMGDRWQKLFQDDQYQSDPVFCLYPNADGQRLIAEKIYQKMIED